MLPVGFEQTDNRLVMGQWKQAGNATGGMSPPLSQRYRNGATLPQSCLHVKPLR